MQRDSRQCLFLILLYLSHEFYYTTMLRRDDFFRWDDVLLELYFVKTSFVGTKNIDPMKHCLDKNFVI